jgi:hypothetical protein
MFRMSYRNERLLIYELTAPSMIKHQVYSNVFTYLPEYSQFYCGFSHLETSKYIYGCCDVGTSYFLTVRFLDVAKFTNLTPLSLLISCKLSFQLSV